MTTRKAKSNCRRHQQQIQRFRCRDSSRPELLRLRAAVEAASGDLEAANRDLKEALSLTPGNVNSLMNFGMLHVEAGAERCSARIRFIRCSISTRTTGRPCQRWVIWREMPETTSLRNPILQACMRHIRKISLRIWPSATFIRREATSSPRERITRMPFSACPPTLSSLPAAANAAMESHDLNLAATLAATRQRQVNTNPQVQRESERYLYFKGDYAKSAELGENVIAKLPNDREGVVYLAYDLYYLGRYDEALALVNKYQNTF